MASVRIARQDAHDMNEVSTAAAAAVRPFRAHRNSPFLQSLPQHRVVCSKNHHKLEVPASGSDSTVRV
jgi:hypothetical protein